MFHVGMDYAPFKKPSRLAGLFSYRSVIPPFPHKTLLCKLSWGPRPTGQGGEQASISSRKRTSEWTALHSKSPAERLGFSHTAPSFLLLPAKLCFANFRRGPGRPAGRQTCKLYIACGDFFAIIHRALILLLLASPPCRATTHCAPFKKPSRKTGLFSYRSVIPPSPRRLRKVAVVRFISVPRDARPFGFGRSGSCVPIFRF